MRATVCGLPLGVYFLPSTCTTPAPCPPGPQSNPLVLAQGRGVGFVGGGATEGSLECPGWTAAQAQIAREISAVRTRGRSRRHTLCRKPSRRFRDCRLCGCSMWFAVSIQQTIRLLPFCALMTCSDFPDVYISATRTACLNARLRLRNLCHHERHLCAYRCA